MLKIRFVANLIDNYLGNNSDIYGTNTGILSCIGENKDVLVVSLDGTVYVDSKGLRLVDIVHLSEALNIVFNTQCNDSDTVRVIECDKDEFYNVERGESVMYNLTFTFPGDIRQKNFDILVKN